MSDVLNDAKLISNLTRGTVVCERAWAADRPLPRMRGLLGRRMLAPGDGLLLHPAPSIHTAAMRFSIDLVFVDREFEVVKVVHRLRPWRFAGASQARSALELAAGEAKAGGVLVGDWIAITTLCNRAGLVVVGDNGKTTVAGVHALAKSGSVDALCRAIKDARADHRRVV